MKRAFLMLAFIFTPAFAQYLVVSQPSLQLDSISVSDMYVYSSNSVYIYLTNKGLSPAVITGQELLGLEPEDYSASPTNPATVLPGLTGVFRFDLNNVNCANIGQRFSFKFKIDYSGTSFESETMTYSVLNPLIIKLKSKIDSVATYMDEYSRIDFEIENSGNTELKFKFVSEYPVFIFARYDINGESYSKNELENKEFTLNPNSKQNVYVSMLPTKGGEGRFILSVNDALGCENIRSSVSKEVSVLTRVTRQVSALPDLNIPSYFAILLIALLIVIRL